MKILNIIVDKLPNSCNECTYKKFSSKCPKTNIERYICSTTKYAISNQIYTAKLKREDFCLLTSNEQTVY